MKRFVYSYSTRTGRHQHTVHCVRLYLVPADTSKKIACVGYAEDTFVSEFQLVMQIMESQKLLPPRAFERHVPSSSLKYGTAWSLADAGIAIVNRVV